MRLLLLLVILVAGGVPVAHAVSVTTGSDTVTIPGSRIIPSGRNVTVRPIVGTGFLEFRDRRGDPYYLNANQVVSVEQNRDKLMLTVATESGTFRIEVWMPAEDFLRMVQESQPLPRRSQGVGR